MKPSVTELIKLLDKPALLIWANKQGLSGINISEDRNRRLSNGTSIHSQIEKYIREGEPFISEQTQNNFKKFMLDKEIISIENKIETEWFTGRYDIKIRWNDKIYLMDFKLGVKNIYFEHKLQLIGYAMGTECDSFAIVKVPEFIVMNFCVQDRTPYQEILKSLSNIYYQKLKIIN